MKSRRLPILLLSLLLFAVAIGLLSSCALTDITELHRVSFTVDGEEYAKLSTGGGESLKLPRDPSKAGYTFLGWYTEQGERFTASSLMSTELADDLTVEARFAPIVYTATLVASGETVGTLEFTVESEGLTLPPVPERAGYTAAWDSYTLSASDTVINAVYTPIVYTLTYDDPMNGTNRNAKSYTVESPLLSLVAPTGVAGYTFLGWFDGEERVSEIASGSTGSLHLTARWEIRNYVINYVNAEGATHSNPATYQIFDAPFTLSDAKRPGYTFGGWFVDKEMTRGVSSLSGYGDRTLYAKWTPISYTVTFMADGRVVGTDSYTVENKTLSYPGVPGKNGYTAAWETKELTMGAVTVNAVYTPIVYTVTYLADGKILGYGSYTVENKTLTRPDIPSKEGYSSAWEAKALTYGNITLSAVYTPIRYTVTYLADGKQVGTGSYTVEDKNLNAPAVPERIGYAGEWETKELTTGDVTLSAVYTIIHYTVTYTANGTVVGSDTYTVLDREVTAPTLPERLGYTGEWEAKTLTHGNVTVSALYTPIDYRITFLVDGERVGESSYNVENKDYSAPAVPDRLGYAGEWETKTLTTGDVTLSAVYTIIHYKVTFTANGAVVGSDTYTVLDREITHPALPERGGYSSVWETKELTVGDVTVAAIYTPIDYTVTFVIGGVIVGEERYNIENTDVTRPSIPEREGYSSGWDTDALTYGNVTVSALYTPIDYRIIFVAGGQTVGESSYNVENKNFTAPSVPDRLGYTGEWETKTLTTGDVTLSAVYTVIRYTVTFTADGKPVGSATYTVEDTAVTRPEIPGKAGYSSAWQDFTLTVGDVTVPAVYTAIVYEITFVAGGQTVGKGSYTVEDTDFTAPDVPDRLGYTGEWETKTLTTGDVTLNAVYTVIYYKVVFIAGGITVGEASYTVEDREIAVPDVPFVRCAVGVWETYTLTVGDVTVRASYSEKHGFDVSLTPATCTGTGLEVSHCPDCGKHVELTLPALGHAPTETHYESATCLADGLRVTVCDRCGDRHEYVLAAIGHAWSLFESLAATCESDGHNVHACTNCGDRMTTVTTALGHLWTLLSSSVSSCMQSGVTDYSCDRCHNEKQEAVIATGHSFHLGTCSDCGQAEFSPASNFYYQITNGEVTITGVSKTTTEIRVPREIDGYPVTKIKENAFRNSRAKIIVIPTSVRSIEYAAFVGCSALEVLEIPFIGAAPKSPTEYTRYPLGYIFGQSSYTGSVGTWQNVTSSSSRTTRTLYYLPSTLTRVIQTGGYINSYDFQSVTTVKEVVYGAGVTLSAGASPFVAATSLERVVLPEGVTVYPRALFSQIAVSSITIPEGITSLGERLFANATSLVSVSLPSTLTDIGVGAFSGCTALARIDLPSGVTSIPAEAFYGCTALTELPLSLRIDSIGDKAFYGCSAFTEITVPSSVTAIGQMAFGSIPNLVKVTLPFTGAKLSPAEGEALYPLGYVFGNTSNSSYYGITQYYLSASGYRSSYTAYFPRTLTSVVITGGEHLYAAFYGMSFLKEITLPASVDCSDYAFYGCSGLTEISLGAGVTEIGEYAFYNCYNLTSLRIAGMPSEIGRYAFQGCSKLTDVPISPALRAIGDYAFQGCIGITSLALPAGLETVGANAFSGCSHLTEIALGTSLTSIGEGAFKGTAITSLVLPDTLTAIPTGFAKDMTTLTSLTLPSSLLSIGSEAFAGCTGLTELHLPSGVSVISARAFKGCTGITEITLPTALTTLDDAVFEGCTALTSLVLHDGLTLVYATALRGCTALVGTASHLGGVYLGTEQAPYMILIGTEIGADSFTMLKETLALTRDAFLGSTFTELKISEGVTYLPTYGFAGAASIVRVHFPSTLRSIEAYAFRGCLGITELTIPSSVERMAKGSLGGIPNLAKLTIPFTGYMREGAGSSYRYPLGYIFGDEAFYDGLTGFRSTQQRYLSTSSSTSTYSSYYYLPIALKTVIVTESIVPYAFYNCEYLETVILPALTAIPTYLFYNCTSLDSLDLPASVTEIGAYAFSGCSSLASVTLASREQFLGLKLGSSNAAFLASKLTAADGSSLASITLPEGTTSIPSILAGFKGLTEITLPSSITAIPDGAFAECTNLTKITLGDGITSIGANAFKGCTSLTEIKLPATVTTVGSYAFSGSGIVSIDLTGVTSLGTYAFSGCSSLVSVKLDDHLTELPAYVFSGCSKLIGLRLPSELKTLGNYALQGCASLTELSLGKLETIGSYAFSGCLGITELVIPTTVTSVGSYIFGANSALVRLTMPFIGKSASSTAYFYEHFSSGYLPKSLTTVIIAPADGATVTLRSGAFQSLSSITDVYLNLAKASFTFSGSLSCAGTVHIDVGSIETWFSQSFTYESSSPLYGGGTLSVNGEPLPEVWTLPEGTVLGAYSLVGLRGVRRLVLPASTTELKNYALYGAGIEEVVLPAGMTRIGEYALYGSSIVRISVPDSVSTIGRYAFYGCTSLEYVYLGDGLTTVGAAILGGCSALRELDLPVAGFASPSSTSLDGKYFISLFETQLTSGSVPSGATIQGGYSTSRYNYKHYAFLPESLSTVRIRGGEITTADTLSGLALDSLTLSPTVTVSNDAFLYVGALKSVTMPMNGFVSYSSSSRAALTSIVFTSYDASISISFTGCSSLAHLTLPSGIDSLSPEQFLGTPYFLTVDLGENAKYVFDSGSIIERGTGRIVIGFDASTIPDYITEIGPRAFAEREGFTALRLTRQLKVIGEGAFAGCTVRTLYAPAELVTTVDPTYVTVLHITEGDTLPTLSGVFTALTEVTLPDSITVIPDRAFSGLLSLTSVTLGNGVTSIGKDAFRATALAEITLPDSIEVIGASAFEFCEKLNTITLSASLTALPSRLFYGCYELKTLVIPNGVTSIESDAFSFAAIEHLTIGGGIKVVTISFRISSLKSLTLCEGVTEIAPDAFRSIASLTEVKLPSTLTLIGKEAFASSGVTSIALPSGVTLGEQVFRDCLSLGSVTLGDGITELPLGSFYGCTALTEITLPSGVTAIGESAFSGCTSLSSVSLGDGLVSIGKDAFRYCAALTEITLPASLAEIGESAFYGASGIRRVTAASLESWLGISFASLNANPVYSARSLWFADGSELSGAVRIPDGITELKSYSLAYLAWLDSIDLADVKTLGSYALYSSSVKSIELRSVETIGNAALASTAVTEIRLPETVVSVGENAFSYCTLTLFDTGDRLTSLYLKCFIGATIDTLRLGRSIKTIGEDTFRGVDVDHLILDFVELYDDRFFDWTYAFEGADGADGISITVGESVTSIPPYLLHTKNGLTVPTFTFLGSPARIGSLAFANLRIGHLEMGALPLTTLASAFSGSSIETLRITASTMPSGIPSHALVSVELIGVTAIPDNAFSYATKLSSIRFTGEVVSIGASAFYHCSSLTEINLPDSLVSIGKSAFAGCSSLTEIDLPDSIQSIGDGVFADCVSLSALALPSFIRSIGREAFAGCTALTSLALPNGVESIGERAFYGSGIRSLVLPSSLKYVYPSSFEGISLKATEADGAIYYGSADNPYLILAAIADGSLTHFTVRAETRIVFSFGTLSSLSLGKGLTFIYRDAIDASLLTSVTMATESEHYAVRDGIFYAKRDVQYVSAYTDQPLEYRILFAPKGGLSGNIKVYGDPGTWLQNQPNLTGVTFVGESLTITNSRYTFTGSPNITRVVIPATVIDPTGGDWALHAIFAPLHKLEYAEFPMTHELGWYFTETAFTGGVAVSQISGITSSYGNYSKYATTYYIPATLTSVTINGGYVGGGYYSYDPWGPSYDWSWGYFMNCTMLEHVTLRGMTEVDEYAFDTCRNLKTITLGAEVVKICEAAFIRCTSVTAVYLEGGSAQYAAIQANSESSGNSSYIGGKFVY